MAKLRILLVITFAVACYDTAPSPGSNSAASVLDQLKATPQLTRPLKTRLRGFPQKPPEGNDQAGAGQDSRLEISLQQIAAWTAPFEQEPNEGWAAGDHHLQGLLGILLQEKENDLAVAETHLETAVKLEPQSAEYWNDLGAIAWIRSESEGNALALTNAFLYLNKALRLKPDSLEANYNYALTLGELGLFKAATQAWEAYLALESDPLWQNETEVHLHRLRQNSENGIADLNADLPELLKDKAAFQKAISTARTQAWRLFERVLMPAWGKGETQDLTLARAVAQALFETNGDKLYLDTLAAVEEHAGDASGLARAHQWFQSGQAALDNEDLEKARQDLGRAQRNFEAGNSPFQFRVAYYLALLDQIEGRHIQAAANLEKIAQLAGEKQYLNLQGEALWVKGQCESALAMPDRALATYRSALPVFQALGGIDNLCGIYYKIASALLFLGERAEGWNHLHQALKLLPRVSKPLRAYQVYMLATDGALRIDQLGLASQYQREAFAFAQTAGSAWATITAELWGARIEFLRGNTFVAEAGLKSAQAKAAAFPNPSIREQMEADCLAVWGEMTQNVALLEQALERLQARNNAVNKASLLCSLAKAYRREGRIDAARRSLEESLAIYESYRLGLSDQLRARLFNGIARIFNEMVSLQLASGDFKSAFDYQEAKRARLLLDQAARVGRSDDQVVKPLGWREIQTKLNGETLLVFGVVDQALVAWFLSEHDFSVHQISRSLETLASQVDRFRAQIERRAPIALVSKHANLLYQQLLGPLESKLESIENLTIVPDGPLHGLPFAAIRHPKRGFLVESFNLAASASANMFLQSLLLGKTERDDPAAKVFLIGNPELNPRAFPQLPRLGNQEVQKLESLYKSRADTLRGEQATKTAFLDAASKYRLIHFNGHAVVNAAFWPRSYLVFADSGARRSGALFAQDLARFQLPQTQLVVLSACSTGFGMPGDSEGIANLARPFLAAGVPAVAASMWDVEDSATSELMLHFHEGLLQGMEPRRALRSAATQLLASDQVALNHPSVWASFQIFGSAPVLFEPQ